MSNSQAAHLVRAVLTPVTQLWTWSGVCFGYRRDVSLFTYDGVEVGRFVGAEVYGPNGSYLGEVRRAEDGHSDRLITSSYKKSRTAVAFAPTTERPHIREASRAAEPLYCGYEEFPSPETLKAAVIELRKQLKSFAAATPLQ
ncbi:MAG TPA: hypothetical protein VGR73_13440 [Bryobacteraceae bacterium]|nr:hypothetical protein [Bryobacteraceae bacterium]